MTSSLPCTSPSTVSTIWRSLVSSWSVNRVVPLAKATGVVAAFAASVRVAELLRPVTPLPFRSTTGRSFVATTVTTVFGLLLGSWFVPPASLEPASVACTVKLRVPPTVGVLEVLR